MITRNSNLVFNHNQLLSLLVALIFVQVCSGQATITLDKNNPINASHEYINEFQSEDKDYVTWLYVANKMNLEKASSIEGPKEIISNSGGNNSLIFTVEENNVIKFDTLRNSVDPKEYTNSSGFFGIRKFITKLKSKHLLKKLNIEGSLPENSMISISPKKWGVRLGVHVPNSETDVKVTIVNSKNEIVATVVDQILDEGWNNFKWHRENLKRGKYQLNVSMEGQTLSQNFKM